MQLEWVDGEYGSTAEYKWLSAWIEPLLGEKIGCYSWSVDIPDSSDPEKLVNLVGGVEPGLTAAKLAVAEAMEFLRAAAENPAVLIWPASIARSFGGK